MTTQTDEWRLTRCHHKPLHPRLLIPLAAVLLLLALGVVYYGGMAVGSRSDQLRLRNDHS